MSRRNTVVIGASAGGVAALRTLLAGLPADFPGRVLVVLHVPASGVNTLTPVLARSCALTVLSAASRHRLEPGVVLVAPPDHHVVLVDDSVLLTRGPQENGHRPAIDVLFRSAAQALGPQTIGVVLSGSLDDGSAGLRAIRSRGGIGVVQDPDDAEHPGMPANAIRAADPEFVLPVAQIPALLTELIGTEVTEPTIDRSAEPSALELLQTEVAMAELTPESFHQAHRPGHSSGLSCPDCHGVLFAIGEADFLRFRCRVGHAWSVDSLLAKHRSAVEGALWVALRTLEEKAALCTDMSERAGASGATISARRFGEQAGEATEAAELLRGLLADGTGVMDEKREGRQRG